VVVHALPSLQVVPAGADGFVHIPVDVSQTPARWHASSGAHVSGVPAMHVPAALHASFTVHGLPSLQLVPAGAAGFEHVPVAMSHTPAT
jgi:hypothetical protein